MAADTIRLAGIAAREWARVGADALGDITGSSLPFRGERVMQPDTLAQLIADHAVRPVSGLPHITDVSLQDVPSISSNCRNLVLSLEQSGEPRALPDSLFVKLPLPSLATRWFFSVIGSWRLESHFCRHVAADVPLRTPVTYATGCRGSRFFLVQENLNEDPSVRLFTNMDMRRGPPEDIVLRCLDAFARLHSRHYHLDAGQREQILPLAMHPFLSPTMRLVSSTLNALALGPCMKKLPGRIPEPVAQAYRRTQRHWDELLQYWFSGPLSLLHGDSHLGNFFVSGDEMGMLDFQAVHWGKGIRDVQYFLIDSLPAEQLAQRERELVAYYLERRAHYGAPLDADATWQEYRSFTYHTLMTIVVSIGFGALNEEQNALMEEILKRAVAAVERVDYAGWLDQFLLD